MKQLFTWILVICCLAQIPLYGQKMPRFKRSAAVFRNGHLVSLPALSQKIQAAQQKSPTLAELQANKYADKLFRRAKEATFVGIAGIQSPIVTPFTGTVFKVKNQEGKFETYAAIATHALKTPMLSNGLLGKEFTALFLRQNTANIIPSEVVAVSPSSMGDIALVKFPQKFESLFQPIELADTELELPAQGYAQGYAAHELTQLAFPIVEKTSTGALVSHLPQMPLGKRAGFCGSAVFTTKFQLVGIHKGSSYQTAQNADLGYIAPISILKNLVDSYHNPGIQPQIITLAGKEIGRLAMDEYVALVEMLDAQNQVVWQERTRSVFSLSKAQAELAKRTDVAAIRLTVGRISWQPNARGEEVLDAEFEPTRTILTPWSNE